VNRPRAEAVVRWAAEHAAEYALTVEAPYVDGEPVNFPAVYEALVFLGADGLPDPGEELTPESPAVLGRLAGRWVRREASSPEPG
jgi:hypothetical protein